MGDCKYCGKPAGFLKSQHHECHLSHLEQQRLADAIRQDIVHLAGRTILESSSYHALDQAINDATNRSLVQEMEIKSLLAKGWESAVDAFLDDGILDSEEEQRLGDFKEKYALSQQELDAGGSLTRTAKAAILRDVLNGETPKRVNIKGSLPINFQKGEHIAWAFRDGCYLEDKARRHFVGGSQGASIRVMKGVYYRIGAFKGRAVESTERVNFGPGWVVITDHNIYFAGKAKSLRIPFSKIVSFESFSDGFGVMRDSATAKPQIFVTGDGWFSYNLVTNIAKI